MMISHERCLILPVRRRVGKVEAPARAPVSGRSNECPRQAKTAGCKHTWFRGRDPPAVMSGALAFVYPPPSEGFGLPRARPWRAGHRDHAAPSSPPDVVGDAALLVDTGDSAGPR